MGFLSVHPELRQTGSNHDGIWWEVGIQSISKLPAGKRHVRWKNASREFTVQRIAPATILAQELLN